MPIFASTTTSGYSDPMRALSIKALEQRMKDTQAQQAAQQAQMFTPENTQTPIQGLAQVANVAADAFRSNRADERVSAQKQQLAQVMSGIDWDKGPTPQQVAQMNIYDPELTKQALTTMAENRRAREQNQTSRYSTDKTLEGVQGTNAVTSQGQQISATTAREGQAITKELGEKSDATARAGQQLQLDLADKAAKARQEEAVAQRTWESAEKRLAEVQANGTETQRIEATKARDEAKYKFEASQQATKLAHDADQGDKGRAADAERQQRQIQATSDLTDKQFGYSQQSKAADQEFTAAQAKLDRELKVGDRQSQIAAAADLAEKGRVHQKEMAKDEQSHQERLANHKIEAAQLAAKTTPDYIKATTEAKDTYANHLLSVEKLKEARALAPQINTGPWQALQTGTALATGGRIGDKASAEATTRFNSIMDEQAILAMSKTLKGQSTDFEMKEFKKVFNNPSSSPADRLAALDRLIAKADTDLTSHREALKSYTGSGDSAARIETGMNAKPSNMSDDAIRSEAAERLKTASPEEAAQINARLKTWGLK